jgi:bifunctional non-homologous end joining protein LigD
MVGPLDTLPADVRALARPAPQPRDTEPMKARLHDKPFSDPAWVFERKLDGVRGLAFRDGDTVRLLSRTGRDLARTYPELVDAFLAQTDDDFVVDGEIVAFQGHRTSFERLQGRMGITDPDRARRSGIPVYLYLFDILHVEGHDVTGLPLLARKSLLRKAVRFGDPLRFVPHRRGEAGEEAFREACRNGWEGLIAKRIDSTYVRTRSNDWLKVKCAAEQELVVGGWTAPKGTRERLGALLVGYYEDGRLRYAGKVGTGFNHQTLEDLGDRLEALERPTPPFDDGRLPRAARWAKPELVAQIGFTEWTRDGRLRHPRYLGLRDDKPASEVVRERPG